MEHPEDERVLEYLHEYPFEASKGMAFGDSDRARRQSGNTKRKAIQRAAGRALQAQHISTGWERPVKATDRSDGTVPVGTAPRSSVGELWHLGVREFWVRELVESRKLVIKKIGSDDNPACVEWNPIKDGQKIVRLLDLSGPGATVIRDAGGVQTSKRIQCWRIVETISERALLECYGEETWSQAVCWSRNRRSDHGVDEGKGHVDGIAVQNALTVMDLSHEAWMCVNGEVRSQLGDRAAFESCIWNRVRCTKGCVQEELHRCLIHTIFFFFFDPCRHIKTH